ncbi:MAG: (d)CMP kinase [Longimicrobiales bacterium]
MIIAIDGPAGSGKSSTARAVAQRLGFKHLDSGAFYRALTLAALRSGWPVETWPDLNAQQLEALGIHARAVGTGLRLLAHDQDITGDLRSAAVNAHVSLMARVPAVRAWLLARLRAAAATTNLVADGRDMGTVVFPGAQLKVFLTAERATRARRRLAEQGIEQPAADEIDEETERLLGRDRIDSEREIAPLRPAHDAVPLDTTALSFEEQVATIVGLARERGARG